MMLLMLLLIVLVDVFGYVVVIMICGGVSCGYCVIGSCGMVSMFVMMIVSVMIYVKMG